MIASVRPRRARGNLRIPVLTGVATAIAVAAALGQYAVPGMITALQRAPGGLPDGQWWRLVTPLLVQTLGWYQVAANLVTLMVLGTLAEWLLGRWRWLALFAGGTLGGEIAAYAWHDPGGGDSIAICGLAAGVAVALIAGRAPPPWPAADAVVYYVAALAGWGFFGLRAAVLAVVICAVALGGLRLAGVRGVERVALASTIPCAVVMTARQDLHGASLVSGMLLMCVLLLGGHLRRTRKHLAAAGHTQESASQTGGSATWMPVSDSTPCIAPTRRRC